MLNLSRLFFNWPIKDLIQSAGLLYLVYLYRQPLRVIMLKYNAFVQNVQTKLGEKNSDLAEIKHLMFNEVYSIFKSRENEAEPMTNMNILEIGIGCGDNFSYYPQDSVITGIETNGLCEKYAWERLKSINGKNKKNIKLNEYLIGFPENMSCIRSDSVDFVVSTNSIIQDYDQSISEILRVLKQGGLFLYLEDRLKKEQNISFKNLFKTHSSVQKKFTDSLMESQFLKEDKILSQRVFKSMVYGISTK